MRKLSMMVVLALALMSSQVFSHTIKLSAQESKSLTNHSPFTLKATCNIQGKETKSKILFSVTENKGQVNGKNLSKGQKTAVHVKNNSSISVSAEPGTTVNLINLSKDPIAAVCST